MHDVKSCLIYVFFVLQQEDYVIISHNFTQHAEMFRIIDTRNKSAEPLSLDKNVNGDWYVQANTTTLSYIGMWNPINLLITLLITQSIFYIPTHVVVLFKLMLSNQNCYDGFLDW